MKVNMIAKNGAFLFSEALWRDGVVVVVSLSCEVEIKIGTV